MFSWHYNKAGNTDPAPAIGKIGENSDSAGEDAIYGNTASLGQDIYIATPNKPDIIRASAMKLPEGYVATGWLDEYDNQVRTDDLHGTMTRYWALTLLYSKPDVVAYVGDEHFATVQDAVTYISNHLDGSHEIVMVKDSVENTNVPADLSVTLNLNGHLLQGQTTALIVAGELTIKDVYDNSHSGTYTDASGVESAYGAGPAGEGKLTGHTATNGGGISVNAGGKVTLLSGTITDCNASGKGGAVYINGGTFIMNGGKITANYAANGAAVYVDGGSSTFIMNGGDISNNIGRSRLVSQSADNMKGGIIQNVGGRVTINEVTISNNTARYVVLTDGGLTNIKSTVFTDNKNPINDDNANLASGVLAIYAGLLAVDGTSDKPVKITNNTSSTHGSAIYQKGGTLTLSNVEITKNTSSKNGVIYQNGGSMIMQTGTVIRDNKASGIGGAVYQNGGIFHMLGGEITYNAAPTGGGLAQNGANAGQMYIYDGKLYGNRSTSSSAGNDVYSATTASSKKSRMQLEAASNMGLPQYNVWRDDAYTGENYGVSDKFMENNERVSLYFSGELEAGTNLNSPRIITMKKRRRMIRWMQTERLSTRF